MKKLTTFTDTIPGEKYKEAFELMMSCTSNDYLASIQSQGILITYKGKGYKVRNAAEVVKEVINRLSDAGTSAALPLRKWIDVAGVIHVDRAFTSKLRHSLTYKKVIRILDEAILLAMRARGGEQVFWSHIYNRSPEALYPKAIQTAIEVDEGEYIVYQLAKRLIRRKLNKAYGEDYFFETITLEEDTEISPNTFFIYSHIL